MKTLKQIILTGLFSALLIGSAAAQEQIAIPLSNPGDPGTLELMLIRGSITISGYDGEEVIVRYEGDSPRQEVEEREDGLRRIPGGASGFDVHERNNEVTISGGPPINEVHFDISVPVNFSLRLALVTGNDITVENVNGEMEISHVNGAVLLNDVGGSAVINTVNGGISASFRNVEEGRPMAFSNVNGDIDITLPEGLAFTARMNTEMGEMFTDFDIDLRDDGERVSSPGRDGFRISVNRWVYGDINGGGAEYMFKSMRGDIFIRRDR